MILNRAPQAKFCSHVCTLAAQSAKRKIERKERLGNEHTCPVCGEIYLAKHALSKYCSAACRLVARRHRSLIEARDNDRLCDKQEKTCPVCESEFTTVRYSGVYCSKACLGHALNGRRIDKARKTDEEPRISPQLLLRRAAAVRQRWSDRTRREREHLVPEMPPIKEPPAISQAERVRSHLRTGNTFGALKIAAGWAKLGDDREWIIAAWDAFQNAENYDEPGAVIQAGLLVLRERLKVDRPEPVEAPRPPWRPFG